MRKMTVVIPLEAISFNDFIEYDQLEESLEGSSNFEEIAVEEPYAPVGLEERWFLNKATGDKWRLVRPDPPFGGIWSKV